MIFIWNTFQCNFYWETYFEDFQWKTRFLKESGLESKFPFDYVGFRRLGACRGQGNPVIACLVNALLGIWSVCFDNSHWEIHLQVIFTGKLFFIRISSGKQNSLRIFKGKRVPQWFCTILVPHGLSGPGGSCHGLFGQRSFRYFEHVFTADLHWKIHFLVIFTGKYISGDFHSKTHMHEDFQWEIEFLKDFRWKLVPKWFCGILAPQDLSRPGKSCHGLFG